MPPGAPQDALTRLVHSGNVSIHGVRIARESAHHRGGPPNEHDTAIVITNGMPATEVADAVQRYKMLNNFVGQILREGTDYGNTRRGRQSDVTQARKLTTSWAWPPPSSTSALWKTGPVRSGGKPFFYYLVKCPHVA